MTAVAVLGIAVVVAVAAVEQSVVSSTQLGMRMKCAGVEWVRQPLPPIQELEPELFYSF